MMLRFVILRHELPADQRRELHWDFMLEHEGVLKTWALQEEPAPGHTSCAEELPDHRLTYLDYEGPVSRNRGTVRRWDVGRYEIIRKDLDHWIVHLHGERLDAIADLEISQPAAHRSVSTWSVMFRGTEDSASLTSR